MATDQLHCSGATEAAETGIIMQRGLLCKVPSQSNPRCCGIAQALPDVEQGFPVTFGPSLKE